MHELQENWLEAFGSAPFSCEVLKDFLRPYEAQVKKMHFLVKEGKILRLKRGLYCVNPKFSGRSVDFMAIANCLYTAPSYVSLETALAHYELIPEAVMGISSVTKGRTKRFVTPIGWFMYQTIPENLFGIGVRTEGGHLIASPEKALCDYLYTRSNLRITSPKTLASYLEEDVRFDFDEFKDYDRSVFSAFAASGYKTGLFKAAERLFA